MVEVACYPEKASRFTKLSSFVTLCSFSILGSRLVIVRVSNLVLESLTVDIGNYTVYFSTFLLFYFSTFLLF